MQLPVPTASYTHCPHPCPALIEPALGNKHELVSCPHARTRWRWDPVAPRVAGQHGDFPYSGGARVHRLAHVDAVTWRARQNREFGVPLAVRRTALAWYPQTPAMEWRGVSLATRNTVTNELYDGLFHQTCSVRSRANPQVCCCYNTCPQQWATVNMRRPILG